jgi:hypothetical protein
LSTYAQIHPAWPWITVQGVPVSWSTSVETVEVPPFAPSDHVAMSLGAIRVEPPWMYWPLIATKGIELPEYAVT